MPVAMPERLVEVGRKHLALDLCWKVCTPALLGQSKRAGYAPGAVRWGSQRWRAAGVQTDLHHKPTRVALLEQAGNKSRLVLQTEAVEQFGCTVVEVFLALDILLAEEV